MQKKSGGGESRGELWGQSGCERRIDDFLKFQKKIPGGGRVGLGRVGGGGGGGFRVDVNGELKFLRYCICKTAVSKLISKFLKGNN